MIRFFKKYIVVAVMLMLVVGTISAQVKVSEFLQKSSIASEGSSKLFFVDFWATWCAPCITAKEQLGVLQEQFPNDLYVISLSKENPLTVEQFLKRKSTNLTIAIDYYGETFSKFNVHALPDGVLFNAKGELIWQGSAPDLKKHIVERFLRQETARAPLHNIVSLISIADEVAKEYVPVKSLEINNIASTTSALKIVDNEKYLKLTGNLKSIIGYLASIYSNQIKIDQSLNKTYEVYFKKPLQTNQNLALNLIKELKLDVKREFTKGESLVLSVNAARFWDTNQFNWGVDTPKFLVGDSQIQGDNVSLKAIAHQLANALGLPVIAPEGVISETLHDWNFHYKFFELMQADLEDNYGILVEKKIVDYPVYHIQ